MSKTVQLILISASLLSLLSCTPHDDSAEFISSEPESSSLPSPEEEFPYYADLLMSLTCAEIYCWKAEDWFCSAFVPREVCDLSEDVRLYQTKMPCPIDTMGKLIASTKQKKKAKKDKFFLRVSCIDYPLDNLMVCPRPSADNYQTYIYVYGRLGLDVPEEVLKYYPTSF